MQQLNSPDQNSLLSSEHTMEVRLDFYRSIESWIVQQLEANQGNLTGLAVLLSDEILHLSRADADILIQCPKLLEGLQKAFSYACEKFEEIDDGIDQQHHEFKKDMEDLDFRVVREKEVFHAYLQELAHSEELYLVSRRLKQIYDVLQEIVHKGSATQ